MPGVGRDVLGEVVREGVLVVASGEEAVAELVAARGPVVAGVGVPAAAVLRCPVAGEAEIDGSSGSV
jgi:hypothetical protein